MDSAQSEGISPRGHPVEGPPPTSGILRPSSTRPERVPSIVRSDLGRLQADLNANQENFAAAFRTGNLKEAATYHKKIIVLRKELASISQFPLDAELQANLRQAALLLSCEDVDSSDHSIFPDTVCRQEDVAGTNLMAWGLLTAKVGSLQMRSTNKRNLEAARTSLSISLNALLRIQPAPIEHLFPIAQCVADLYDYVSRDIASAEGMVEWLNQQTGQDTFKNIITGRVSKAVDWAKTHGFDSRDQGFDVAVMEHAIKQNEPKILETMLIFMERTRPSSTLPSKLLLTAADSRNMTISQMLFEHKAKVDALDEGGKSVLHRCLYSRDAARDHQSKRNGLKIAGFFLSKDAALLDKQDHSGKTALYIACEVGYTEMVAFLLECHANANLTENNAQAPLYMACERGRRHVVKCLLDKAKDIEIDAKGPGGQTPLTVAVQYAAAHAEGKFIVELLLRKGADPLVEDNTGKTAINYIGGIWASDLKSALKNARSRSTASPVLSKAQEVSLSARSSLDIDRAQKPSRPPSTRQSMFAKIMQPRGTKSGSSSLFSPSRTSLETVVSRPTASIFSNDMSSRRTSITTPSIMGYDEINEEVPGDPSAFMTKEDYGKPSDLDDRRPSTVDDNRAPRQEDAARPNIPSKRNDDSSAHDNQHQRPGPNPEQVNKPATASTAHPIRASQDTRGSTESYHSSTDSDYDTPSESEDASHDGDGGPLETRMNKLSLHSQPSGIRQRPADQSQSGGSFDGSSSMPTPPSDLAGGNGKRRRIDDQNDDEGSRGGRLANASQAHGSDQKRQVLLACPFAKKDPITYEHCHSYELKEIKHVKQHLKRCHLIIYCARCREKFPSQVALERHHRDDDACPRSEREVPEGMTLEQHETLKPRTNHKLSLEEQWYFIWRVLFPGREQPSTPYKDEFVNMTEFHRFFTGFMDNQIPVLATRVLQEMGNATPILHDQAVNMMRRSLREFASGLHNSGLIGQNGNPSTDATQSRSASIADTVEPSPSHRLSSFGDGFDHTTPDFNGPPILQQNSPATTRLSSDDHYQSLHPIKETSSDSSSYRQGSAGPSSDSGHAVNQAIPSSVHAHVLPQEVPYRTPEWNAGYNMQPTDPTHSTLFGVGAEWNETVEFGNANSILYSPNHLFNMDTSAIEQIDFQVGMDVFGSASGGVPPPATGPGYFPAQHGMAGQQVPFVPFMGRGQAPVPYQHGPQNTEGQPGFSPTPRQAADGQGQPWGM